MEEVDQEPDSTSVSSTTNRWQFLSEGVFSQHVPSPAVARPVGALRSTVLQRRTRTDDAPERINTSLRTLDSVLGGASPVTTPLASRSHLPTLETSVRSPNVTLSLMNESGVLRRMELSATPITPRPRTNDTNNTGLFSQIEDQSSFQLSLDQSLSSPPLKLNEKTYPNHPMLQVGLELMATFHNHLQEKNSPAQLLELLEGMEQTCAFQIDHLKSLENPTNVKDVLRELQLERDTWQLMRGLYSDRLSSSEEEEEDMIERELLPRTDKSIIEDFYSSDKFIRQAQIVVDWLEDIASRQLSNFPAKVKYYTDSVSWESTLHDVQHNLNTEHIVTELDPDGPSRQKRHLSDLDEKDEASLAKHLFECVRAGDINKAQELCLHCGQSWKSATLDGWKLYHDPNLLKGIDSELEEVEGNLGRTLWKSSCWELVKSSSYCDHEKALYAALSGNISHLLPVCQNWYDYVWAYFKVMVDVRVEQKLLVSNRYPSDDTVIIEMPQDYWKTILVPELIFQEIEATPSHKIRRQCTSCYHKAQKHIILGSLDGLVDDMHEWLKNTSQTHSHLLRFMAHLVLFVKAVHSSYHESKCNDILEAFIKTLVSHHLTDLVALYCSYLPPDRQVTAYSSLLESTTEPLQQKKCLELARECGLDVASITKQVVTTTQLLQEDVVPFPMDLAHDPGISESDRKKIDVLDWLFYEEVHRDEALRQSNALIREFLAVNKYRGADEVFQKIPSDTVTVITRNWSAKNGSSPLSHRLMSDIHEYVSIEAYLKAIKFFNLWFEHFHLSRPVSPSNGGTGGFMEQVAFDRQSEKHQIELEQWTMKLTSLVSEVKSQVYNVLMFVKGGWMSNVTSADDADPDESNRVQQMKRLREICIPRLCFLLHSVLHSSQNYKDCFELASVIASESHGLHEVFRPQELKQFLKLMYSSSVESSDTVLGSYATNL
ncbi:PREDICTED: nuclear pore complex protein Nup107-like isoform X1 [Amphimedon queenslandica]|uniref:Nuclear pore complex protein n=1 Tax=Amphimedon queenslandica TaxID=400682 RepID=A0A1X7VEM5_AMPQE|nr:PREDICTED: nuclear pore complex protein Nup107-like isoform X1 [Amphimedon queenslandica]|eukprot:XP_019849419.1 PREDICTED: nuclear pore complex protein Nup107-like isoform X1 [Amphimedon queenslandica]